MKQQQIKQVFYGNASSPMAAQDMLKDGEYTGYGFVWYLRIGNKIYSKRDIDNPAESWILVRDLR